MLYDFGIDLSSAGSKKMSWGDRAAAYLDYDTRGLGDTLYVHGLHTRLAGFHAGRLDKRSLLKGAQGHENSRSVTAYPGEIQLSHHLSPAVSVQANFGLLMEEQAFFSELMIEVEKLRQVSAKKKQRVPVYFDLPCPASLQSVKPIQSAAGGQVFVFSLEPRSGSTWLALAVDGFSLPEVKCRNFVSGKCRISLDFSGAGLSPMPVDGDSDDTQSAAGRQLKAEIYCVWAEQAEEAAARAAVLVQQKAIAVHRTKINQFLDTAVLYTNDHELDTALAWSAFSGWSMVTREYGPGIWAGLPWFRDNWGRDTFIAVPGILLVCACYEEARLVIKNFADRQNMDSSSADYGRIPNRWRSPDDVIFNTVDGTLWFIREIWDYYLYTADVKFIIEMWPHVCCALSADLERRCDADFFLKHEAADTWMDARIEGVLPWSERSDRAVEVQALWYTALQVGLKMHEIVAGLKPLAADSVLVFNAATGERTVFKELCQLAVARLALKIPANYWLARHKGMADRLLAADSNGAGVPDKRCRSNVFLALTAADILQRGNLKRDAGLFTPDIEKAALESSCAELVLPYGVCSLSVHDLFFHPAHENPAMYHKDAAYHNGTIWGWSSGSVVSLLCRNGLSDKAFELTKNISQQLLHGRCPGALSENLHACPDKNGMIVESGTWLQAWSVSEFTRNIWQDYAGLLPDVPTGRLIVSPCFPAAITRASFRFRFGYNLIIEGAYSRNDDGVRLFEFSILAGIGSADEIVMDRGCAADCLTVIIKESAGSDDIVTSTLKLKLGDCGRFIIDKNGISADKVSYDLALVRSAAAMSDRQPLVSLPAVQGLAAAAMKNTSGFFITPDIATSKFVLRGENRLRNIIEKGMYNSAPLELLADWYDSPEFMQCYNYSGKLGVQYSTEASVFRLWAPLADAVSLCIYHDAVEPDEYPMQAMEQGVWSISLPGDLIGVLYTYRIKNLGLMSETIDPYAYAAGVNGTKGAVLNLKLTNPDGWNSFSAPRLVNPTDAVIYEVHVRDLSSHSSWNGPSHLRGGFAGAHCQNLSTKLDDNSIFAQGFDYLCELGVTHVQLLPVFDFASVDESKLQDPVYNSKKQNGIFNWGYDPQNYNVPEGSYSSNPADPGARIKELKELILALGKAGIGVVMDVVYNHVPDAAASSFELCVPGYYFRRYNYSGAGSDTASERFMFRKFMVDSLAYWLTEYKLCGFRFDLMGLHDLETMQLIEHSLRKIKSDVLLYGEGWDMYRADKRPMASMLHIHQFSQLGMFNDAFRCGLKGLIFEPTSKGWLQDGSRVEDVAFGVCGAVRHPQIQYKKIQGTARPGPWTENPASSLNYTEIHDNLTLHDKLLLSMPGLAEADLKRKIKLALGLILTAQGIPVMHAGMEFLRTKEVPEEWKLAGGIDKCYVCSETGRIFCHDSYKAGDLINGLDWERAARYYDIVKWVRELICFRKAHQILRMSAGKVIRHSLHFLAKEQGFLAWRIDGLRLKDDYAALYIAANSGGEDRVLTLADDLCTMVTDGQEFYTAARSLLDGRTLHVPAQSFVIVGLLRS